MSDSVDRVFVHALATVRRLPRTGSSRPPPSSRLRLYGLYKQSMEGDVATILPRPTLPVSSPDPNTSNNNNALHKYASRDLRTREAQAEIEKWDAWHACAGMTRTEAKRQYISTLIETMKEYASGTSESRELVSELEFVWNQIREQSGSDPDHTSPRGSQDSSSKESPTRKLERSGMSRRESGIGSMSFGSLRASGGSLERRESDSAAMGSGQGQTSRGQARLKRTESGLRVLSPVSQRNDDSVVDAAAENGNGSDENNDDHDNEILNTAPTSPLAHHSRQQSRNTGGLPPPASSNPPSDHQLAHFQHILETHLSALKTEIAALREQLSANHLLSSSTFSHTYYSMTTRQRILHRLRHYIQTYGIFFLKQAVAQLGVLLLVLLWGRVQGDLRVENWVKDGLAKFRKKVASAFGGVAFWLFDLFGPDGRFRFVGRILRLSGE